MSSSKHYDAIIVGGGPAGSAAATVLAREGWNVVIVEKGRFPRYHIGESLIPYCYFPLERLGLVEKMNETHFTKKYSVQFVGASGKQSQPFYFFQHWDHPAARTWQVVRSEFDQMLLDNARASGADVLFDTSVKEFIKPDAAVVGVHAQNAAGEELDIHGPVTIDATGRDALSMRKFGWRVREPKLEKMSIWTYYKGALRDEGYDAGATTVAYVPEKGWFWYIPLPDDVVSVGITADAGYLYRHGRDPEKIFQAEIGQNVWIRDHLSHGAQFGQYWATGDYSYRSRFCAQDGLVLTGDAFSFLDPVFSSGVFLALRGGELAGHAVSTALEHGICSAEQFNEYGDTIRYGIESMRKLVYAFYDQTFSFKRLLLEHPDLRGDLTDCLMGDLFKDFSRLFDAVEEFGSVPGPLSHGCPLVAAS